MGDHARGGTVVTDTLLGERYRLDQLIGRGGMAAVWSATDTLLGRRVAIKRLHAGLLADEEHAERFRREAVLVARLSHPNLVHLLDRGEDRDGPYLVMELVEGENLKTRVRREGALDPEEAARICGQVGRALAYAHGQGVVHRDIKAQNVLLTADGEVKLADFGIARLMEADEGEALTRTDMLLGSADYLSPEQADGRPVDARTDVYSLGILLYECLTGALPFTGRGLRGGGDEALLRAPARPARRAPRGAGVAGGLRHARRRQGAGRPLPRRRPLRRGPAGPRPGHGGDAGRHRAAARPARRGARRGRRHRARAASAPPRAAPGVGPGRAGAAGGRGGGGLVRAGARRRRRRGPPGLRAADALGRARLRPPGRRRREPERPRARRSTPTRRPPGSPSSTGTPPSSGASRRASA